jgi:branched-chain amino acid aminotransferase
MFDIPYSAADIDAACNAVLAANNLTDAYVRPLAWRGTEQLAVSPTGTTVHVAIAAWEWPSYFEGERMAGIRMGEGKWRRPSPETAPTEAKASGLYMIGSMAKQQAEQEGYADALLLDWRGYVAEATGANVFLVIDGDLHTPSCEGFLNGLTRQSVISLARQGQMKVIERHIEQRELGVATEVFLAGTAAEVTAVREIGQYRFTPGRITETLMKGFDDLVLKSPREVTRICA